MQTKHTIAHYKPIIHPSTNPQVTHLILPLLGFFTPDLLILLEPFHGDTLFLCPAFTFNHYLIPHNPNEGLWWRTLFNLRP
jgi:hypothetical protein